MIFFLTASGLTNETGSGTPPAARLFKTIFIHRSFFATGMSAVRKSPVMALTRCGTSIW